MYNKRLVVLRNETPFLCFMEADTLLQKLELSPGWTWISHNTFSSRKVIDN